MTTRQDVPAGPEDALRRAVKRGLDYLAAFSPLLALGLMTASLFISPGASFSADVTEYRPVLKPYQAHDGSLKIAIREFGDETGAKALAVDPFTLESSIVKKEETSRAAKETDWQRTPFASSLARYTAPDGRLSNSGMRSAEKDVDGAFLTIDLCPSKKPLDRGLFEATLASSGQYQRTIPIAIAISGAWIRRHREDLRWLQDLESSGTIRITWINHSETHPYHGQRPLDKDFLLSEGVDFENEVLANEITMIESGITPTPFFRFPGLISDGDLLQRLRALSLIPIGADAWLAKKERPEKGSFMLIHGNGNEPEGISALMEVYRERFTEGKNRLRLLPLEDAFKNPR